MTVYEYIMQMEEDVDFFHDFFITLVPIGYVWKWGIPPIIAI